MSQIGMEQHDYHHEHDRNIGSDGWVEINNYNTNSQHQSPILSGYDGYSYIQPISQSLPLEHTFDRMPPPPPTTTTTHSGHHQLLPLIMPSHPTWPSMLTNPAGYQAPPVAIPPPPAAPLKTTKLPSLHTSTPRKTLTDADRRRMCQYHEENPSIKQTEIGGERTCCAKYIKNRAD
jgi:hypothetical protein